MKRLFFSCALLLHSSLSGATAEPQGPLNVIGRQSQNEGILVVKKSAPIKIDGDLGEWNEKSRIWCFPDYDLRESYSVEVTACWDAE